MKTVHYAFLSKLIPQELYDETIRLSRKNMQDAANALQWHLYNGLSQNLGREITLINTLPIHSWPQYYRKAWLKRGNFDTQYSRDNINVGFCNIKGIRKHSQSLHIYSELKKWCKTHNGDKTLFVYTLSSVALKAIKKIKKTYPEVRVCVIIADLPDMISLQDKSIFTKLADKIVANVSYSYQGLVDAFVLLTEKMADYMNIDKPYCVVEGIATAQEKFIHNENDEADKKTILYAGTLHRKYGILNLLEAFEKIDKDNYELIICGNGDSVETVKETAKNDTRIVFMGQLPRNEVLKLQAKATVVVNPRQNVEEFTKYSFPSKNLECLSSGTPLIAYKLDGIPDEYDEYIFYVDDNSTLTLRDKLIEVCEMPKDLLSEAGRRAQAFVWAEKNEIAQTKIIVDMLRNLQ